MKPAQLAVSAEERPSPGRLGLARACRSRVRAEWLQYRRAREALFFTIAFPPLMLLLFGTIFNSQEIGGPNTTVSYPQYFVPGMIGVAIWTSCLQNLAITVAQERDSGALKRLAGTPMPRTAYFIGKIAIVLLVSVVVTAVLIVLGVTLYSVRLPSGTQWLTFAWAFLLGVGSCTLFGLAVASVVPNGRSASAIVTPFAIVLQFLSGVYLVFGDLPGWLQTLGSIFPLRWITLGLRSVFLPSGFRLVEPQASWHAGLTALVLLAWCAGGLLVVMRTFRWR
jgi:ABC-2 type transport system permease protein